MKFPPIAPDLVIELRLASPSFEGSQTDSLKVLQEKMQEYMDSGVRLGWMFNPQEQAVEIYRLGQETEIVALRSLHCQRCYKAKRYYPDLNSPCHAKIRVGWC